MPVAVLLGMSKLWIVATFMIALNLVLGSKAHAAQLNVLTYNVWGVPLSAPYIPARMKTFCKVLRKQAKSTLGWDVVLIQEA